MDTNSFENPIIGVDNSYIKRFSININGSAWDADSSFFSNAEFAVGTYIDVCFKIDHSEREYETDENGETVLKKIEMLDLQLRSNGQILPGLIKYTLEDNLDPSEEDEIESHIRTYITRKALNTLKTHGLTVESSDNIIIESISFGNDGLLINETEDTEAVWLCNPQGGIFEYNKGIVSIDSDVLSISSTSFDETNDIYRYLKVYGADVEVESLHTDEDEEKELGESILTDNTFDFADTDIFSFIGTSSSTSIDFVGSNAVKDVYCLYFEKDENIKKQGASLALQLKKYDENWGKNSDNPNKYLICVYGGGEKSMSVLSQPFNLINLQDNWRFSKEEGSNTLYAQSYGNVFLDGIKIPTIDTGSTNSSNSVEYVKADNKYTIKANASSHQIYISPNTISGTGVTSYGRDEYFNDVSAVGTSDIKAVGDKSEWFKNATEFKLPLVLESIVYTTTVDNTTDEEEMDEEEWLSMDSDFSFSIDKNTSGIKRGVKIQYKIDMSSLGEDSNVEIVNPSIEIKQGSFVPKTIYVNYMMSTNATGQTIGSLDEDSKFLDVEDAEFSKTSTIECSTSSDMGLNITANTTNYIINTSGETNDVSISIDIETDASNLGLFDKEENNNLDVKYAMDNAYLVNFSKEINGKVFVKSLRYLNKNDLEIDLTGKKLKVAYVPYLVSKENAFFMSRGLFPLRLEGIVEAQGDEIDKLKAFVELNAFVNNEIKEFDSDILLSNQYIDFNENILTLNGEDVFCDYIEANDKYISIANMSFSTNETSEDDDAMFKIIKATKTNEGEESKEVLMIQSLTNDETFDVDEDGKFEIEGKSYTLVKRYPVILPKYDNDYDYHQINRNVKPYFQLSATTDNDKNEINIDYWPLYTKSEHAIGLSLFENSNLFKLSDKTVSKFTFEINNLLNKTGEYPNVTAEYYELSQNDNNDADNCTLDFYLNSLCSSIAKEKLFNLTIRIRKEIGD